MWWEQKYMKKGAGGAGPPFSALLVLVLPWDSMKDTAASTYLSSIVSRAVGCSTIVAFT